MYEETDTTDRPFQSDTTENRDEESEVLAFPSNELQSNTPAPLAGSEQANDPREPISPGEEAAVEADQGNPHDGESPAVDLAGQEDPLASLASLREEVRRLERELTERQSALERMGIECEEFHSLYPDVPLSHLGDDVWEAVRRGVPIAAAHALSERKKLCLQKRAESENLYNRERSPGALATTPNGFFSCEEVRAMSADDVRRNYHNIMLSMQKWGK